MERFLFINTCMGGREPTMIMAEYVDTLNLTNAYLSFPLLTTGKSLPLKYNKASLADVQIPCWTRYHY